MNERLDGSKLRAPATGMDTHRLVTLALLICIGVAASVAENALPPLIPLAPGAKLGLGNIAPLIALILLGVADAFIVAGVKCLLSALISGGLTGLMYSLPATVVALAVEALLFWLALGRLSVPMISLIGAVVFNVMQLAMACVITGAYLLPLLPWFMLAGLLAGAFTGLLTYYIIKRLPFSVYGGANRKKRQ